MKGRWALLFLCAACSDGPPVEHPTDSPTLAITNVSLIDAKRTPTGSERTVVIVGERIAAIGGTGEVEIPRNARIVEGRGKFLIPGLWDMHTHVLWEPGVRESFLPLLIANGITGIRDMGGTLDVLVAVREDIEAGRLLSPRIVAAGPFLHGPIEIDPRAGLAIGSPEEARRAVDSLAEHGVDFIKVYTTLSRDAFFAVIDQANRYGLPVAGHVPFEVSDAEASDAGMKSIEHMRSETGGFCTSRNATACEAIFDTFRRNNTWQTPTLSVRRNRAYIDEASIAEDARLRFVPRALYNEWQARREERLRTRPPQYFADVKVQHREERWLAAELHGAGIPILAGSDAGDLYSLPGFTLHDELALLVEVGFSPMEALQAATLDAARYLDASDSLGTVAVGNLADLLLLDANPLEDIHNTTKISAVVLNGRLLDRSDLDALLARVEAAAQH